MVPLYRLRLDRLLNSPSKTSLSLEQHGLTEPFRSPFTQNIVHIDRQVYWTHEYRTPMKIEYIEIELNMTYPFVKVIVNVPLIKKFPALFTRFNSIIMGRVDSAELTKKDNQVDHKVMHRPEIVHW